jgi:hypothetical protein
MADKQEQLPVHLPGTVVEASYREVKRGKDVTHLVIDDPRILFHRAFGESNGGKWDNEKRELVFDARNVDGFKDTMQRVGSQPYFEITRGLARYALPELKDAGFQFCMRPLFPKNPNSSTAMVVMAPTRDKWIEGEEIVYTHSRAKDEQIEQIREAIATNKLDDLAVQERLNLSIDEMLIAIDGQQFTIPQANKILASVTKADVKSLKAIRGLMNEGKYTPSNSKDFDLTEEGLESLTQEQAYKVLDIGRRALSPKQRNEIKAFVEAGALERRGNNPDDMTQADYYAAKRRASVYMTPEMQAEFENAMRGFANEPQQAVGHGRKDDTGRYTHPVSDDEKRHNSILDVKDATPAGFKQGEPRKNGVDAYEIGLATPHHLLGLNSENKTYVILERGQEKGVYYRSDLSDSISSRDDLKGQIITIDGAQGKRFVGLSDQESIPAAICEADAKQTLLGMREEFKSAGVPSEITEGIVVASREGYASVLVKTEEGKKTITVPVELLDNPEPAFMQEAKIVPLNAGELVGAGVGAEQTQAQAPAKKATRSRAK